MKKLQNKGITLIALVITVIVLLILAGITINLTIGEDGVIRKAQEAGKNYIDAAENEKLQLGVFTNEMDNIIGGSINSGREPYNSEFRKNVVEAIKSAGVETTENDTDERIVANIGKILQEKTKDATATADNITEGKTAWVNGVLITGNGADNKAYYEQGTSSGFDLTSLASETNSGSVTNNGWLTFVPTIPFNQIKIIRVFTDRFYDGDSVPHKLSSIYWLKDGEIFESWTDLYSQVKIENGEISYSQGATSLSKKVYCTVYY